MQGLPQDDPVRSPSHYTWITGVECKAVARHFDFLRGAAIKYIWRSGRKRDEPEARALRKAIECLEARLEMIEPDPVLKYDERIMALDDRAY